MRGPLNILKELWTRDDVREDVKTTNGYVLDLRERLEQIEAGTRKPLLSSNCAIEAQDRTSKTGELKVGDRALILLPAGENKLLMHWKGPFPVTGRKSDPDYLLNLGHRTKLFHNYMRKRYEERQPESATRVQLFAGD